MDMTPEERVLALAMYRLELRDLSQDMADWPLGLAVTSNAGSLDLKAENMILAEWRKVGRERQISLLRAIGGDVILAIAKEQDTIE